jgi:hypothetical protein
VDAPALRSYSLLGLAVGGVWRCSLVNVMHNASRAYVSVYSVNMRRWTYYGFAIVSLAISIANGWLWMGSYVGDASLTRVEARIHVGNRNRCQVTTVGVDACLGGVLIGKDVRTAGGGEGNEPVETSVEWDGGGMLSEIASPIGFGWTVRNDPPNGVIYVTGWAIYFPCWFGALVAGPTPLIAGLGFLMRVRQRRRRARGLCPLCGYDLRASPTRCPECGETRPCT